MSSQGTDNGLMSSPRIDTLSLSSSSGARTPTDTEFRHTGPMTPPAHVGMSRPTTGITIGDNMGGMSGMGFGLREPPRMRRAMTKDGKSALSVSTTDEDDDHSNKMDQANANNSQSNDRARAIRGTLTVKLISARNLAVNTSDPHNRPEPYVVAQFEQNEFVSRPALTHASPTTPGIHQQATPAEPISSELHGSTRNTTIPRTNSYGPSLGIASISRAFADAARRTKGSTSTKNGANGLASGQTTPKAPPMSPGAGQSGGFFGKNPSVSSADPVWKEDVSL
jgi:hypothetical protein